MTTAFGIRPAALPAWESLRLALMSLDRPVPCRAAPQVWTSDDPAERAIASRACSDCPVITLCAEFARLNRETAHVWAGLDRTPRRGRPPAAQTEGVTA